MGWVCNYFVIVISFVIIISIGYARNTEFSRHRVVRPTVHHARTRREISSTKRTNGFHRPEVTIKMNIDDEEYVLDLRLNEDLLTDDHVLSYQHDGRTVLHRPTREELDLCQYWGEVRGRSGSWVALSTCRGVRGVLYDGRRMRHIEPVQGKDGIQSPHYVYDHADLNTEQSCGHVTNNEQYHPLLLKKLLSEQEINRNKVNRNKREADGDTQVRGPFNSNKMSRYVELVLVADRREFQASGEDIDTVHRQMKDVANIINSLYNPLNIFVALVGVVVWTEQDEIVINTDGDTTLTNFLRYRKTQLLSNISNDNAHLITRQIFEGGVVWKALKGPICTAEYSGGLSTNHAIPIGLLATNIAHSLGHSFGMDHDNEHCTCPDERCIMSASYSSIAPVHWSSCSSRSLVIAFERGMDYCLRNKPNRLFGSMTCGNGFVEPGEQCDCGLMADKRERNACHACCEPSTCMLRHSATCATGACCDLQTCRPKPAGAVCRGADKECDLPEYCTGHSEFCPRDVYKMDSTPCGKNEAYCYHGWCRSHADQCRLLWGSSGANSPDRCYNKNNIKGDRRGNCGYDLLRQTYKPCAAEDATCGLLQCTHQNERLEFGLENAAILSATYLNFNGTIDECRTAIIDLGLSDVDPGLVPDGAKCGEDKMCVKQKCVPVEEIRAEIRRKESSVCPSDCSGHGVCNSEGHCHCEDGFAQPLCTPPPGASVDPASATGT